MDDGPPNARLRVRRRDLRKASSDAERCIWTQLRGRRLCGAKFRRQHSCGPFILDFFCEEAFLAVELDGGQHFDPIVEAYDRRRTRFLEARGIRVLRFANDDALLRTDAVLEVIRQALIETR